MDNNINHQQYDRREVRQQRREERRAVHGGGWVGGIVVVLLGLVLLAQNLKIVMFQNWWALFILLPALGSFGAAWRMVQVAGGHFSRRARGLMISGIMLILVAGMFLFNLNWTLFGPVLLILAGISLLVNAQIPE